MRISTLTVVLLATCLVAILSGCAECDISVQKIPSPDGTSYVELMDLGFCGGALRQPKRAIVFSDGLHRTEMALIDGSPDMTIMWKSDREITAIIYSSSAKHPLMRSRKDWRGIALSIEYRGDLGAKVRDVAPQGAAAICPA